ncbi:hypothetical protein STSP_53730 [Streptomyces jeddahensis]|uniref:Uncharacterized protein n=1 Tax=Streptomyces jeddahensis TaxID=1716141 RepID=A0A177HKK3_9ACTN|nr:hypothetical protein STSP_53730 [Streptomyces jeddahensis]
MVLAPVAATGLLAPAGSGDEDAGDAQEVGRLPGVDAWLGGLAVLGEGVLRVGVQPLQLIGRARKGLRGAQDPRAVGHDALDREPGLGREERVRGRLGVLHGGRHARVEAVLPGRRGDVGHDALRVDQAFQEGVRGEAVGAVDAGAGDLAARVQARHRGTAVLVGADAAGGVVRGRGDRDRIGDGVDAVGAACREDRREALLPHLGTEVAGVQVHVLGAPFLHAAHDALGDDVPGRELGEFVLSGHEAHAVRVDEVCALAAYRLGDQWLLALRVGAEEQHGGVELDEFQVADLGSGAQRERDAVARRHGRVGRRREDLPHAAGREDHGGRVHRAHAVVLALAHDVQRDTGRAALGVRQQVQDQRVLDGAHATRAYRLDERAGDLGAGRVAARVCDTAAVVAALAGELDVAGLRGRVEVGAGVDEAPDRVGALGDEDAHGLLVAQSCARDERVLEVLLGGVPVAEGGRDAALRPARGAVVQPGLGDHDGLQARRLAAQCRGQSGHAGADDHDVGCEGPAGGGRVQPYAGGARRRAGARAARRRYRGSCPGG